VLDLEFDQEQELLRQTVRDVLARHCPPAVVRQMEDDPVGYPASLWAQLGELDLIGLLLPDEYGGSAMSLLEGVALYEELGRTLAPTPHFVSAVMSGGVLAAEGSDAQKDRWLRPVTSGEAIVTPAWLEPDDGFTPRGVAARAVAEGSGFRLSGLKRHVAFASAADRLLVLARTGEAAEAVDLFLVDPAAPGVSLRQQFSLASDTQYEVALSGVAVDDEDRIGPPGSGWATWQQVLEPGLVLLAAQAVGGARYALEITTQYAKDRWQFDKPLGAFQSRAHYLADAVTALRGRAAGPRGGLGRGERAAAHVAGPDGQAVRLHDLPRHHRDGPADLRGYRLHAGLRHPALLPPGEAAAADVGRRPHPRGRRGGRPARLTAGRLSSAHRATHRAVCGRSKVQGFAYSA